MKTDHNVQSYDSSSLPLGRKEGKINEEKERGVSGGDGNVLFLGIVKG